MALIDLLSLNDISLKREFDQLKKLKDRFKLIWTNSASIIMSSSSEIDEILHPMKLSRNGWPNRKASNKLKMSTEKFWPFPLFSLRPFVQLARKNKV